MSDQRLTSRPPGQGAVASGTDEAPVRPVDRWLRPLGIATLVANMVLVVTGGAVRLTGSGLGCPTWPRCTGSSFTPHGALNVHQAIEFGNRTLTFVLVAVAVATFVATLRSSRRDLLRLSILLALGIPAQAVIGGVTVLTDLNPWIVSFHLLTSLAIIGLAVLFLFRLAEPHAAVVRPSPAVWLTRATFVVTWAVLYVGTVVTGSGPHAGDAKAPRNGLDPLQLSQAHADLVMLLVGLSVGTWFLLRATGAGERVLRAARLVVLVEVAQGVVGFVQYFTNLPLVLVAVHMLGAAILSAVVTRLLLLVRA